MKMLISMALLCTAAVVVAGDEPLRVYAFGAPGAAVYVAPVSAIASQTSDSEIGRGAFDNRYLRGTVPLQVALRPGEYLVSVMRAGEQSMRDASLDAHEHVWDGYDFHALVGRKRNLFRYAQCYLVTKQQGFPVEVLAVFSDKMDQDRVLSFDCGPQATPFTGSDEEAVTMLTGRQIQMTFHDEIIKGLRAGHKVILWTGQSRYAIQADGPANLRIRSAAGTGAWAGHKLSIVPY